MDSSPSEEINNFDVLLCYSNVEAEQVKRLQSSLGAYGIHCWVDYDQPIAGRPWRPAVEQGYAKSTCTVVVLGPAGVGKCQAQEIRYLIDICDPTDKPLIFVVLPNADESVLDGIGSRGLSHIRAAKQVDEREVVERVVQTVKPRLLPLSHRLGLFRGLQPRPRSCFLAVPRIIDSDLLPVFLEVAEGLKCSYVQDIDSSLHNFTPDVLDGVANSSMVLADCRCVDQTDHIDPAVGHVLGIARAYAKPIVAVIDAQRRPLHPTFTADLTLEIATQTGDALSNLKKQLVASVSRTLASLKYHGMVSPDAKDMLVLLHGALRLKPTQWKFVGQVIDTCRKLADEFYATGHLLAHLRVVTDQADVAEDEPSRMNEAPRWWNEFCKSFNEDYCKHYIKRIQPVLDVWQKRRDRLNTTADLLARNEPDELGKVFGKVRDFLTLTDKATDRFVKAHDILLPQCAREGGAWPMGPFWYHQQLVALRGFADDVVTNALATIGSFLPLFGHEAEQLSGSASDGSEHESVALCG